MVRKLFLVCAVIVFTLVSTAATSEPTQLCEENAQTEPESPSFVVVGEVMRPGEYELKDETTLLEAVNFAGGPTQTGSLKKVTITRKQGEGQPAEIIHIDVAKVIKGETADQVIVEGDIICIPKAEKPKDGKILITEQD